MEANTVPVVVADIVTCNGIVAGRVEADTIPVIVADSIACKSVVAGRGEVDADTVVAGCVVSNGVIV